jgi:hypothetical protein
MALLSPGLIVDIGLHELLGTEQDWILLLVEHSGVFRIFGNVHRRVS